MAAVADMGEVDEVHSKEEGMHIQIKRSCVLNSLLYFREYGEWRVIE